MIGTQATIDGVYRPGQPVVLFDDLVTTAGSKLSAIRILEAAGLVVKGVCVLIDREQGGKEELKKAGYDLYAAFTLRQLLDHYREMGMINAEQHGLAIRYLDDPVAYQEAESTPSPFA